MKILLVCPSIPDDMPYLQHYIDFLKSHNILFDLVYLNTNNDNISYPNNYFSFKCNLIIKNKTIYKLFGYLRYSRFVIYKLSNGNYTHVITMGIACSVFLAYALKKKFKYHYIYDIRDYSQILRIPIFRSLNNILLRNSYINVISSDGFKKWLPLGPEYTICHNTTKIDPNDSTVAVSEKHFSGIIRILTIGQIRDIEANTYVINQLSNSNRYEVIFSGKGIILASLKDYVKDRGYINVAFTGKYNKAEEDKIVEHADFLNVCMGDNMVSNYLLSNRLYLAARLRKPLISFSNCYQSEIIKKYNLGIIIERTDNLAELIEEYIDSFNYEDFTNGCKDFLQDVQVEMDRFINKLNVFIDSE